jgi:uncharacterized damage-inducible protein DinB
MNNHSLSIYQYNTWANSSLVGHLKQLPKEVCFKEIKSVFPSIFQTLTHIYIIDRGWYSLLTKEYASDDYEAIKISVERLIEETCDISLEEFHLKQIQLSNSFHDFITSNDMENEEIFSTLPMRYADVIQHVVNHGTYHRGNITAMLHQLNHSGIATDYGLYLYNRIH